MSYRQGEDLLQAIAHDLKIDGWTFEPRALRPLQANHSDLEARRPGDFAILE